MPDLFVPLDVNFQDDDKILEVSAAAELVYVRAIALAKRLLTDGYVSPAHLRRLCDKLDDDPEDIAGELVDAELIAPYAPPNAPHRGGYRIASWMKHNRTAEEVREASEQGRLGALIRWHKEGKHEEVAAPGCPKCPTDAPPNSPPMPPPNGDTMHSRDIVETETEEEHTDDDGVLESFEEFWNVYPARNGKKIGKSNALIEWRKLGWDERRRAYKGAVNLGASDQLPKDAERFLRRAKGGKGDFPFDDWQEPAADPDLVDAPGRMHA